MSKKNIIVLIIVLIVSTLAIIFYKSEFLAKKIGENSIENNRVSPTAPVEEDTGESPNIASDETKSPNTGKISDEACIEIYAYALRMAESSVSESMELALKYENKIEELEKKYGVDSESDYFDEYCSDRFLDDNVQKKLYEKMGELGSDIE